MWKSDSSVVVERNKSWESAHFINVRRGEELNWDCPHALLKLLCEGHYQCVSGIITARSVALLVLKMFKLTLRLGTRITTL